MTKQAVTSNEESFFCGIVEKYVFLSDSFIQSLGTELLIGLGALLVSLATLRVVVVSYALVQGKCDSTQLIQDVFMFSIIAMLLYPSSMMLLSTLFNASIATISGASAIALNIGAVAGGSEVYGTGICQLVIAAENGLLSIILSGWALIQEAEWYNFAKMGGALLLIAPFFILMIFYFAQIVVAIFRIMLLAAFSPFLLLASASHWTRGMAAAGVRTLLSSFMVLFAATVSIGLAIYGVGSLDISDSISNSDGIETLSNDFLLAIIMGWIALGLMTEATSVANSVAGSALSNAGAAVITGGLIGSATAVAKYGAGIGGAAFGGPAGMAGGAAWNAAQTNVPGMGKGAQTLRGIAQAMGYIPRDDEQK